jgi:hypothetical protein
MLKQGVAFYPLWHFLQSKQIAKGEGKKLDKRVMVLSIVKLEEFLLVPGVAGFHGLLYRILSLFLFVCAVLSTISSLRF